MSRIFDRHCQRKSLKIRNNLGEVKGSGDQGRIIKKDVRNISLPPETGKNSVSR